MIYLRDPKTVIPHAIFDGMTHGVGGDGTTFSATTSGPTPYLVVTVNSYIAASGIPSGVTFNGVQMSLLTAAYNAYSAASAWGLASPPIGTYNVIYSGASLNAFTTGAAFAFHGTTADVGAAAIALGAGAPSVTVASSAGQPICGHTQDYSGSGMSPTGTFVELFNNGFGVSMGTQDGAVSTLAWSGSDTWSAVAVSMPPTAPPNLVPNGSMELTTGWIPENTPISQGRSTTQVHGGTYSWEIVAGGVNDGIQSDPTYTTIAGHRYWVGGWTYNVGELVIQSGNGGFPVVDAIGAVGAWAFHGVIYTDAAGGSNGSIYLRRTVAGTLYVDDWIVVDLGV